MSIALQCLRQQAAEQARREAEAASWRLREEKDMSEEERKKLLRAAELAQTRVSDMQLAAEKKEREVTELNEVRKISLTLSQAHS